MYKDIIKPTLVLVIIVAVMSALLAVTYNVAGIAELGTGLSADVLEELRPNVLPSATKLVSVKAKSEDPNFLGVYKDEGGSGHAIFLQVKAYGPEPMKIVVGIDSSDKVAGVSIVESSETPGLGTKVEDPAYLSQYAGKSAPIAIEPDGGEISAIAGATKSSRGLTTGVDTALKMYESIKGGL